MVASRHHAQISQLRLQQGLVYPLLNPQAHTLDELGMLINQIGIGRFCRQAVQHGLAPLWFERIGTEVDHQPVIQQVQASLRQERIAGIAAAGFRQQAAKKVQGALTENGVPSVIFKGTHLGLAIYPESALRPAVDVDVLIPHHLKKPAVQALLQMGAQFSPSANTIGYQCACRLGPQEIDLHWHLVRPGRLSTESAQQLLVQPRECEGLIVPNASATLFTLLVHPILSTRPGAPDAKLIRLVDLALWIKSGQPGLESVLDSLERSGMLHVAWLMNEWLARVSHGRFSLDFPAHSVPGRGRRKWLTRWLPGDTAEIAHGDRLSVQFGYRTALHTRPGDALKELMAITHAKITASREMNRFSSLLTADPPE